MAELKDSGDRTDFGTGAVRDMGEGKGRCDLLPLDVISAYLSDDIILYYLHLFQRTGMWTKLYDVLMEFDLRCYCNKKTQILELAIHFEDGAMKYGENNWQNGIPVSSYINSAVRHYLKYLRGDADEPHDRAFCWNIVCAIWTCKHIPEMNVYWEKEKDDEEN